jgi:hypothetical protein
VTGAEDQAAIAAIEQAVGQLRAAQLVFRRLADAYPDGIRWSLAHRCDLTVDTAVSIAADLDGWLKEQAR